MYFLDNIKMDPNKTENGKISMSWADSKSGEFKRQESQFRNWISQKGPFKPEPNRYHLYVSLACPWGMFAYYCDC